jgi:hypothetical protein
LAKRVSRDVAEEEEEEVEEGVVDVDDSGHGTNSEVRFVKRAAVDSGRDSGSPVDEVEETGEEVVELLTEDEVLDDEVEVTLLDEEEVEETVLLVVLVLVLVLVLLVVVEDAELVAAALGFAGASSSAAVVRQVPSR